MTEESDFFDPFSQIIFDQAAAAESGSNGNESSDETPAAKVASPQEDENNDNNVQYNSRKPKWWKTVAGRTTKAQKQAIATMEAYKLPNIPWGEFYDWASVFAASGPDDDVEFYPEQDIWFEIGFGQGENLLALARKYPHRYVVGAEIHEPALGKAFQRMQQAIEENQYWTDYDEYNTPSNDIPDGDDHEQNTLDAISEIDKTKTNYNIYSNLRIYRGDGIKVLPRIPSHSLAAVLVTFPDPFPKTNHKQWRVIQQHTLRDIHRILKPSGRLFLATDHEGFHQWSHGIVDHVNQQQQQQQQETEESSLLFDLVVDTPDRREWLPAISKYERKGWDEGRKTWLSCWEARK